MRAGYLQRDISTGALLEIYIKGGELYYTFAQWSRFSVNILHNV